MTGQESMRQVVSVLEGEGTIKERLFSAATIFWSAMYESDPWLPSLQAQAEELIARLLEHGTIRQTVNEMDELTAQETAELLLRFAREFERVAG